MKRALIVYYSHMGHTARVARTMEEAVAAEGWACDRIEMMEAVREGTVDWSRYDVAMIGSPIVYGVFDKLVWEFVRTNRENLDALPNSFFCICLIARTPFKAIPENNRYLQTFLSKSPWRPKDLKCIAGKVDYPHWNFIQRILIKFIMKLTGGPTDSKAIIDYTDWDDVRAYARHCLSLADR